MTDKPQVPKDQIDRFKETARQLGCDEDEATFDEKLKQIAKVKPKVDTSSDQGV